MSLFRLKMAFLAAVFVLSYAGLVMTMMSIGHAASWPVIQGRNMADPTIHESGPMEYVSDWTKAISGDPGGSVAEYERAALLIRLAPEHVVAVDGTCWSACTLFAAMLNRTHQVCLRSPNALFGIHQAGYLDAAGRFDEKGRRDVIPYPAPFSKYISRHGGEPNRGFMLVGYAELSRMIPRCS